MEKSSFKLTFLVFALLIIASCSHVGEARSTVITLRCNKNTDCAGQRCWCIGKKCMCNTCFCQNHKCVCKVQSSLSDAIIGAQVEKPGH
ncbi:hypothetical protein POPTR_001G466132v4 [Populus trichocarpa]|uniref:CRC domain-containing protein n=1 Tax=Populus trichocarpa TaxID=3694 RepID=A0A3N7EG04_POPTR|nr:hypothetical protein BDE02_01G400500 [Populus trichocarpa]RQO86227.1 hypothetical protein POPTR_001G466132v4 [Populus trichocarpa]